ncbi:Hypothetical protein D9617_3g021180 [Elsinoe fawcettii]|nr:Hypothetical protein D9617_3g021180 [Elsinoe fawcettii]
MKISSAFAGIAAIVSTATPALADAKPAKAAASLCPPGRSTPREQLQAFNDFVEAFVVRQEYDAATFNKYIAEDYIQHNPFALSGRQAVIDFFASVPRFSQNNTIINKGFGNGVGYIHYRVDRVNATQPSAVVDIFRYNGSCIQEHWDVIQERPANSINPIALF